MTQLSDIRGNDISLLGNSDTYKKGNDVGFIGKTSDIQGRFRGETCKTINIEKGKWEMVWDFGESLINSRKKDLRYRDYWKISGVDAIK